MYVFTACQPTQAVAAAPPANIVLADASRQRRHAGKNDETESEGQWSGMQSKQRGRPRFIVVPVLAVRALCWRQPCPIHVQRGFLVAQIYILNALLVLRSVLFSFPSIRTQSSAAPSLSIVFACGTTAAGAMPMADVPIALLFSPLAFLVPPPPLSSLWV